MQNTDTVFAPVHYSLLRDVPSWADVNLEEPAVFDAEEGRLRVQIGRNFLVRRLLLCNVDIVEAVRHLYLVVVRCAVVAVCREFLAPGILAYDTLLLSAAQVLAYDTLLFSAAQVLPVRRICYP